MRMSGPTEHLSNTDSHAGRLIGAARGKIGGTLHQFRGDGLRARAMRGSSWTLFGFGTSQVLRLGSNLILTRLLFPEAFGLMALAQVFLQGLNMLSDIGVGPSIVQNKRGDDPDFLATAWTMQVIRGFTLFLCMCALAYPASLMYDQPLLLPILIMLGLTSIIQGFQSIGMSTASRKMLLGRLTLIDLVSQSVAIVVMVVWAYYSRDVWALVGGGIAGGLVRVAMGHRILSSPGNRFHFERSAAKDIFHFGKWIFLATTMTYLGGRGLTLIQATLVPIDVLGMISIAGVLAGFARGFIQKIGSAVLFPAFSSINRDRPSQLRGRLKEARSKIFWMSAPFYSSIILFSNPIVVLLYDERYSEVGGFLSVLAINSAIASLRTPFGMTLISCGDSFGHSIIMSSTAIASIALTVVGFWLGGVYGMLVSMIITQIVVYPIEAWRLQINNLWMPLFDGAAFLYYILFAAAAALFF